MLAIGDGALIYAMVWLVVALAVLAFSVATLVGVVFMSFQGATWGAKLSAAWSMVKGWFGKS